ncbi:hypothetical protein AUR64_10200 [Haloprofundus marisrubri]|uniref:DUF1684 domain-containing protein n=1 Tax=Haloprofundus marisrubri TaxID=1514971 RepID=A0A0W1R9B1_9EURY|nr:DUF1684 domain-containing protein [Haloprofundus marisrubri]KTG09974.1 hypothetical protein AUR64_10200 [Haloprofundus marisrubri]
MSTPTDWEATLEQHRDDKNEYFRDSSRSPIPETEQPDFVGLDYYPPDDDYRFELDLHDHDEKEAVVVATTADGEREYLRWGEFRFEIDGEEQTLQAYRRDEDDPGLWVPFRDDTSGEETYGAGRYLDLHADEDRANDRWVVDFNLAYNPFCAYSARYECPMVPVENWLDVAIEAGEKTYESGEGYSAEA